MGNGSFSGGSSFSNFDAEEIVGRVILIAIIVLFMAVVFVLLLHLYARIFWWRVEQQHLQHQHQHQSSADSTIIGRLRRRRFVFAQGQDPSRTAGLDPSILRSISVVVFCPQNFKDGLECAVCLSDLVDGDKARILPSCNHGFHVDCIDMWFQSHSTCPVCRNTVGSIGGKPEQEDDINDHHVGLSQDQNFESGDVDDHHNSSQNPNSNYGLATEPLNFPTNILIWGDQNQVNSTGIADIDEDSNNIDRTHDRRALAIDIPAIANENVSSTPSGRYVDEEDPKSPVLTRLRSLKRLLSSEKRNVVTSSSSSAPNNV